MTRTFSFLATNVLVVVFVVDLYDLKWLEALERRQQDVRTFEIHPKVGKDLSCGHPLCQLIVAYAGHRRNKIMVQVCRGKVSLSRTAIVVHPVHDGLVHVPCMQAYLHNIHHEVQIGLVVIEEQDWKHVRQPAERPLRHVVASPEARVVET